MTADADKRRAGRPGAARGSRVSHRGSRPAPVPLWNSPRVGGERPDLLLFPTVRPSRFVDNWREKGGAFTRINGVHQETAALVRLELSERRRQLAARPECQFYGTVRGIAGLLRWGEDETRIALLWRDPQLENATKTDPPRWSIRFVVAMLDSIAGFNGVQVDCWLANPDHDGDCVCVDGDHSRAQFLVRAPRAVRPSGHFPPSEWVSEAELSRSSLPPPATPIRRMAIGAGFQFGKLTVLREAGTTTKGRRWFCRCACGAECIKRQDHLLAGRTRSCGCLQAENRRAHAERRRRRR